MPQHVPTPPRSHRCRLLPPKGTAWLAGLLIATAFGAGAPGIAWAKGRHATKKDVPETTPAADQTEWPDPTPEATPGATPPTAPTASPAPAASPALAAPPPAAPMVDASGRLQYGPPGAGMGSVTVKGDKMQISFDGRSFGVAPLTITNVPRGDYVVEGTAPDGTQISRPVSVEENAQATVDLGAGVIGGLSASEAARLADGRSGRLPFASKVLLGASAAALGVGIIFGALEWKAHRDYEAAPADQATLDALARSGHRDAMFANVGFIACGAALVASGVIALPSLLKSEHPTPEAATVAFTATAARGSALAGVSLRF
jgi:hypothetical protein